MAKERKNRNWTEILKTIYQHFAGEKFTPAHVPDDETEKLGLNHRDFMQISARGKALGFISVNKDEDGFNVCQWTKKAKSMFGQQEMSPSKPTQSRECDLLAAIDLLRGIIAQPKIEIKDIIRVDKALLDALDEVTIWELIDLGYIIPAGKGTGFQNQVWNVNPNAFKNEIKSPTFTNQISSMSVH